MKWFRSLFHPLAAFIGLQLVWVLFVVLWIYWFVGRHQEIRQLATRYGLELAKPGLDWAVLVEGIILLLALLGGIYVIFVYWKRQSRLYREQKEFISQVTHELKSPLASIRLHLETIRLRKPSPDRVERFLDMMLMDTERLDNLINNLLMAAKFEQRRRESHFTLADFSGFVSEFMERKREKLPEGGNITVHIEPRLKALIDMEEMGMVLRNLFENAVLYSPGAPDIAVNVCATGKDIVLTFCDRGIGLERQDLKKIFRMFYRVRRPGENVRGSGLGLYIVRSVVTGHGGTIAVASDGPGKGCTFTITIPRAKE